MSPKSFLSISSTHPVSLHFFPTSRGRFWDIFLGPIMHIFTDAALLTAHRGAHTKEGFLQIKSGVFLRRFLLRHWWEGPGFDGIWDGATCHCFGSLAHSGLRSTLILIDVNLHLYWNRDSLSFCLFVKVSQINNIRFSLVRCNIHKRPRLYLPRSGISLGTASSQC